MGRVAGGQKEAGHEEGYIYPSTLAVKSDISSTNLQKRFGEWQEALESKGLKVNADKTDTVVCARTAEPLQITDNRKRL